MPRLFTYTVRVDDGAAPNPFHGICTLAICKPGHPEAKKDDWVAGLGSKKAPGGDLSGKLVYAMKSMKFFSLQDYDRFARDRWPHRIPNIDSMALQDRLGDCIYNYASGSAKQRAGVHDEGNVDVDIGGKNALISRDFYYFGNRAIALHSNLLGICHQTQGHRSTSNAPHLKIS